jgi:arsenite/tail-anchored protein-transporting ATPase
VHESFQPIPILTSRLFDREMVGAPLLAELGTEVYGDLDATAILHHEEPLRVRKRPEGYVLSIRLPFIERANLDVFRKADELFVRIGSYKRNVILPHVLQRLEIQEASFVEDRLEVRFGTSAAPAGGGSEEEGEEASG